MAKTHYNRSVNSDKIVVDANLKASATLVIPVHAGDPDLSPGIDEDGHIGIQNAGTDPALFFKAGGNIYPLANAGGLEQTANKNTANGYAGLDGSGKVAAAQLPSYVDDVLEYANYAALPGTGESGKIYVTLDDNKEYRWSGSTYIQIVASPGSTDDVAEGSTNLYFTAARVLATVLTGIGFGTATAITAADSILSAFGKLQAQITQLFSRSLPPGGATGKILAKASATDYDGVWIDAPTGGGGSPGGADKQIQFNNAGSFGGSSKLTFDGSVLNVNNAGQYLGSGAIEPTALMQLDSAGQGLLIPRMTEAQRLAIVSPAIGLKVYQTDAGANGEGGYEYRSTGWAASSGGVAGTTGQIQVNGSGSFSANDKLTFDSSNGLVVTGPNYHTIKMDSSNYTAIALYSNGTQFASIGRGGDPGAGATDLSIVTSFVGGGDIRFYGNVRFVSGAVYLPASGYLGDPSNTNHISYGGKFFQFDGPDDQFQINWATNLEADSWQNPGDMIFRGPNIGFCDNTGSRTQASIYAQFMNSNRSLILNGGGSFTAEPSAQLQVDSTTKGILPPRMTTTQKNAISSPAEGLQVYDTTLHKMCFYNGSAWETITSS